MNTLLRGGVPQLVPMPDTEAPLVFQSRLGKVTVELGLNECAESPLEWDGMGEIRSFNRKHCNFWNPEVPREDLEAHLDKEFGVGWWRRLGYFEHGNCIWFPWENGMPLGTEGDFRWDGNSFAGVWAADMSLRKWLGRWRKDKRATKLDELCTDVCGMYTDWCNGEVYTLRIELVKPGQGSADAEEMDDENYDIFGHNLDKEYQTNMLEWLTRRGLTADDLTLVTKE